MESTHSRPDVCGGTSKTFVKGDQFIDEDLLAELRAVAAKPAIHPNAKVPTDRQIEILHELYPNPRIQRKQLAQLLHVSPETLRKWWSLYGK